MSINKSQVPLIFFTIFRFSKWILQKFMTFYNPVYASRVTSTSQAFLELGSFWSLAFSEVSFIRRSVQMLCGYVPQSCTRAVCARSRPRNPRSCFPGCGGSYQAELLIPQRYIFIDIELLYNAAFSSLEAVCIRREWPFLV